MKLAPEVLIEIMSIVQSALLTQTDASEALRSIDLTPQFGDDTLILSDEYKESKKEN